MRPSLTAASRPAPGWSRVDGVDLLRGFSIVLVLLNHIDMQLLFAHVRYARGLPPQLVHTLVWSGQYGVQIFFVVSGFLITSTSIHRWGAPAALCIREFYLLRFARIAPLLLSLLAVLSVLHLAHVPDFAIRAKAGGLPRALFAALTFHINLLEATRAYLPGNWDILWSLSVEEMFYLFFPLVARLLPEELLYVLLTLLLIAGPVTRAFYLPRNEVWYEYSYLGGMDAIALGCLTAMLLRHRPSSTLLTPAAGAPRPLAPQTLEPRTLPSQLLAPRTSFRPLEPPSPPRSAPALRLYGLLGALLLAFILCDTGQAERWGLVRTGLDMSLVAIGAALLIAASAQSRWQAPRLLAPLRVLGQRSYEIYLTHMFVVLAGFAVFRRLGKPLSAVSLLFLAVIVLAGALGYLVAIGFAEPSNRHLRRRFHAGASTLGAAQPEAD